MGGSRRARPLCLLALRVSIDLEFCWRIPWNRSSVSWLTRGWKWTTHRLVFINEKRFLQLCNAIRAFETITLMILINFRFRIGLMISWKCWNYQLIRWPWESNNIRPGYNTQAFNSIPLSKAINTTTNWHCDFRIWSAILQDFPYHALVENK